MKAKGTWVLLIFVFFAAVVGLALSYALRDIFVSFQVDNTAILGDAFRLNDLIAYGTSLLLGLFFGVFYGKSRKYIEQVVVEFSKVAWPEWSETKTATLTVVMVSLVASVILGIFDTTFSWASNSNFFLR